MAKLVTIDLETGERVESDFTPTPYQPTTDDVNKERDRRIAKGAYFRGMYITGSATDARNLMSLAIASQMRIAAGDTTTLTIFRDGNNSDFSLTPMEVIQLWQWSAAYVENLYKKSWELKAVNPIPLDYTDDRYWAQ
jgi:hypothetical protein